MTVIVALRHHDTVVIGGERGLGDEATIIMPLTTPKVWRHGPYLFGYSGTTEGQIVQTKFLPPPPKGDLHTFMNTEFLISLSDFYDKWQVKRTHGEDETGLTMIICVGGQMYEHTPDDMSLVNYDSEYVSIGSGSDYAYGSLWTTKHLSNPKGRVKTAIEAACAYSPACMTPVDVISMKIKNHNTPAKPKVEESNPDV